MMTGRRLIRKKGNLLYFKLEYFHQLDLPITIFMDHGDGLSTYLFYISLFSGCWKYQCRGPSIKERYHLAGLLTKWANPSTLTTEWAIDLFRVNRLSVKIGVHFSFHVLSMGSDQGSCAHKCIC